MGNDDDSGLLWLGERLAGRGRRILAAYLSARYTWKTAKGAFQAGRRILTFTISVPGDDDLFPEVQRWILEQLPASRRRALLVRSKRRLAEEPGPGSGRRPEAQFFLDGETEQTMRLDGRRVKVGLSRPAEQTIVLSDEGSSSFMRAREKIVFTCWSEEARRAVERLLADLAERSIDRDPRLYVCNGWSWNRQPRNGARPLESVVLRRGQKERLLADLGDFLGQEDRYRDLGVPWHRGYLFHGPAGTGKTSAAKALADHFGLDAYYLPVSVVSDDSRLVELLSNVGPRSILVLEDVDVVHGATTRDDTAKGVTLSGLLNALDGLVTPHGLVTVMTTNRIEALDPALIRPGRADVREEMGPLDRDQFRRLVEALLPESVLRRPVGEPEMWTPIAPAEVVEAVKRNLAAPRRAVAEIEAIVLRP